MTISGEMQQWAEEEDKLREVILATQTSLYVDLGIIIIVYVMVLAFVRRKWNIGLYVMLGLYLAIYSFLVFFGRKPNKWPSLHLDLFWSYREAFNGFEIKRIGMAREILLNVLVYIPLGMILVALFPRNKIIYPVLIGVSLSVGTEILQYTSWRGIAELDDVMNNGLGLALGIVIMRISLYKRDGDRK